MSKLKKSLLGIVIMTMIIMTAGIAFATASSGQTDMSVLEAGKTLKRTGFFAGDNVRIDGTVDGTVFATGSEIRINGTVNGDLFVTGQSIYIDGDVKGNIYGAGMNVYLRGKSENEVFIAGQNMTVEGESTVARDMFIAGQNIDYSGKINRDLFIGGESVAVAGTVGRNANIEAGSLSIQDGAEIEGNLSYKSPEEAEIASGASVAGETDWEPAVKEEKSRSVAPTVWGAVLSVASALLIWFLVEIWRTGFWDRSAEKIVKEPLKTIGVGVLVLAVTPILLIMAMITIVGIPLGIIAGIAYGIAIYLSKIVVAVCISRWMEKQFKWRRVHRGVWTVLLGLAILSLLSTPDIPVFSFLVGLVVTSFGLGSLFLANYKASKVQE